MKIKNLAISATVAVVSIFSLQNSSFAKSTKNNISIGYNGNLDTINNYTIGGKLGVYSNGELDVSLRPELSLLKDRLSGGASLTIDKLVGDKTFYSGFGTSTNVVANSTTFKPFALIGASQTLDDKYSVFGQVKLPFESYDNKYSPVINIGIGYSI